MREFLEKVCGSNYYIVDKSMGSYGEPSGHPNYFYSIEEYRGGHLKGSMAISYCAEHEYLPYYVVKKCKELMNAYNKEME